MEWYTTNVFRFVVSAVVFLLIRTVTPTTESELTVDSFVELRAAFKNHPPFIWHEIVKQTKPVSSGSASKPTVILLVGHPTVLETHQCLSQCLSSKINKILNKRLGGNQEDPTRLLGSSYSGWSSSPEFYDKVVEILHRDKVVVIEDIQNMHINSAIMFVTLADPFSAPVKNGVIILTVTSTCVEDYVEECPRKLAQRYLKSTWAKLSNELFDSILERIAGTAIMVVDEDVSGICTRTCIKNECPGTESFEHKLEKETPDTQSNKTPCISCPQTINRIANTSVFNDSNSSSCSCPKRIHVDEKVNRTALQIRRSQEVLPETICETNKSQIIGKPRLFPRSLPFKKLKKEHRKRKALSNYEKSSSGRKPMDNSYSPSLKSDNVEQETPAEGFICDTNKDSVLPTLVKNTCEPCDACSGNTNMGLNNEETPIGNSNIETWTCLPFSGWSGKKDAENDADEKIG